MTLQQLRQGLSFLFKEEHEIGIVAFFLIKEEDKIHVKKADIDAEAREELRNNFLGYINSKIISNAEINYGPLSEADDRRNSVYHYDIDEPLQGLEVLNDVLED